MNNKQQINDDEIDLMELIINLWKKKNLILSITVFFAISSIVYALTAKEQWTSKAEVIAPQSSEFNDILLQRKKYSNITSEGIGELNQALYDNFTKQLRSINTRIDFFKQSNIYKNITKDLKSEKAKMSVLSNLTEKQTVINWPNKKKDINYPTISFYAEEPKLAQQTLKEFISFINKKTIQRFQENFWLKVENKIIDLDFNIKQIEEELTKRQQIRLENLQLALSMAKKAGIKEYSKNIDGNNFNKLRVGQADIQLTDDQEKLGNNTFLFLLGENYLQAQIDTLKNKPIVFPPKYHNMKLQLTQLNDLIDNKKDSITAQSFYYQSAPYLPLQRDKPRRALIVLMGTFVGSALGVLVALLMTGLEGHKKHNAKL